MNAPETTAERLERAIREAIDAAPPLTDEQRDRVAHLLRSSGPGAKGEAA